KDIMPIIKAVPDAKYIICNVANNTNLNEEEMFLFKNTTVLMDSSGRALIDWPALLSKFGTNKFCFGSQSPILDYCTGLLRIESRREREANEETKELLRSGNIMKMVEL